MRLEHQHAGKLVLETLMQIPQVANAKMDPNNTITDSQMTSAILDELNTSSGNPNTTELVSSLYSYPERVLIATFFILISILNITGNTTVILAVVFSKKLWTSTNVFVISLSVADLLTGLGLPMSVVALLSPGDTWPFASETPCFLGGLLLYVSAGASLLHLASIAINRAVLIKCPKSTYLRLYTNRNLAIMVVVMWLVAILVMLLPPLFEVGGFGLEKQFRTCTDLQDHPGGSTFELIQSGTFYIMPSVVIFSSYMVIFLHVRRHFKMQKASRVRGNMDDPSSTLCTGEANTEVPSGPVRARNDPRLHRINKQQLQITLNLFFAVCVFFFCVSPFFLANLFAPKHRFLLYGAIIFLCNSCANSIVYAAKHPQFKMVMRRILRCQYAQIEEPSYALKYLLGNSKFNINRRPKQAKTHYKSPTGFESQTEL